MRSATKNEVILPCGCHKVTRSGGVLSCLRQVSSKGVRGIRTVRTDVWHTLPTTRRTSGYMQAAIHGKTVRVNRLVARNFIANPFGLPEVQHENGIRADNRAANLKWGTPKDNAADRERHGRTGHGVKNPMAKLDDEAVRAIRLLKRSGRTLISLAQQFGVSKKAVLLVVQRKSWAHVVD
jgi:hypothetical protein